jgi:TolA-binding protein
MAKRKTPANVWPEHSSLSDIWDFMAVFFNHIAFYMPPPIKPPNTLADVLRVQRRFYKIRLQMSEDRIAEGRMSEEQGRAEIKELKARIRASREQVVNLTVLNRPLSPERQQKYIRHFDELRLMTAFTRMVGADEEGVSSLFDSTFQSWLLQNNEDGTRGGRPHKNIYDQALERMLAGEPQTAVVDWLAGALDDPGITELPEATKRRIIRVDPAT